jgi:hypothetical protein
MFSLFNFSFWVIFLLVNDFFFKKKKLVFFLIAKNWENIYPIITRFYISFCDGSQSIKG